MRILSRRSERDQNTNRRLHSGGSKGSRSNSRLKRKARASADYGEYKFKPDILVSKPSIRKKLKKNPDESITLPEGEAVGSLHD